jgi:hypothetical protein
MRRTRGLTVALTLTALVCWGAGCAGSAHDATLSGGARHAQQNVIAICAAADPAAVRAAGGSGAIERDIGILLAEVKARRDPSVVRRAIVAFRTGKQTTACGPDYADRVELQLLPQTPPQIVQRADVSSGLPIFRRGAITYYRTHFGASEDAAESECVTTSAGLFEHESQLENFLYLLSRGNAQARQLLAHLRADCRAEGR